MLVLILGGLLLLGFIGLMVFDTRRARRGGEISRQGEAEAEIRLERPRRRRRFSRDWPEASRSRKIKWRIW